MADTEKTDSTTWTSLEDYRLLGNSGLRVSPLCMGARQIFVAVFLFLLLLNAKACLVPSCIADKSLAGALVVGGGWECLEVKISAGKCSVCFFFGYFGIFGIFDSIIESSCSFESGCMTFGDGWEMGADAETSRKVCVCR